MEFITSKAKVFIPNYELDNLGDSITFFSKTNSAFKVQFTRMEMQTFIGELVDKFGSETEDEIYDLKSKVSDLEDELKEEKEEKEELEERVEKLEKKLKEFDKLKQKIEELYALVPD